MRTRNIPKLDLGRAGKTFFSTGKAIVAGATGAAVALASTVQSKASDIAHHIPAPVHQKPEEAKKMKKSTLVALFVALGAIAGVLGALYVYILRREKELDEYEQLLFSEDFPDDLNDDFEDVSLEDMNIPTEQPEKEEA